MSLAPEKVRDFYDRFGSKQDAQAFYERPALDDLLAHASLRDATSVFEFGCGTGRLAAHLLGDALPPSARYVAADVSSTMLDLTRARLAPFGARAEVVRQSPGDTRIPLPDRSVDRVLSTYVLDLLPENALRAFVAECARVLAPGGRLCVASLGFGSVGPSGVVARGWHALWRVAPGLVGGCRPIRILEYVGPPRWRVLHHRRLSAWTIPSEVLVAEPVAAA